MSGVDEQLAALIKPIVLRKPVKVLEELRQTITLREPTGDDLEQAGYPMRFDPKGRTEIDTPSMSKMIARLAGIPDTAVSGMAASDWSKCSTRIAGFLGLGADQA
jgi:hypothetical protein